MSVYRRVCTAPVGSPPSDSPESKDGVQARTGRNSEHCQKSRSPLLENSKPPSQAKVIQEKMLTRGGVLREGHVDVLLSAIHAFGRIAGLYNRHLNSNRGSC
jgi:hypothetical protein